MCFDRQRKQVPVNLLGINERKENIGTPIFLGPEFLAYSVALIARF